MLKKMKLISRTGIILAQYHMLNLNVVITHYEIICMHLTEIGPMSLKVKWLYHK